MNTLAKANNVPGYVKDTKTNVVTNVDGGALLEYKNKRAQSKRLKELEDKVQELSKRIENLENDLLTKPNRFQELLLEVSSVG